MSDLSARRRSPFSVLTAGPTSSNLDDTPNAVTAKSNRLHPLRVLRDHVPTSRLVYRSIHPACDVSSCAVRSTVTMTTVTIGVLCVCG